MALGTGLVVRHKQHSMSRKREISHSYTHGVYPLTFPHVRLNKNVPRRRSATKWTPPKAGKWFLVLTVQKPKTRRHPLNPNQPTKEVGIDLNSKEYVFSDGTVIPMPKFFFGGFPVMGTPITYGANRLRGTRKAKPRLKSTSGPSAIKRRVQRTVKKSN